jgi:uncharacterized protein
MSWLLDVNIILASRWTSHLNHVAVKSWLGSASEFRTCAITELGFLRISLSPVYRATWHEAQETLRKLHAQPGYRFLPDGVDATESPASSAKDTTDAHLVALARRHGLKLATLDADLLNKPWAAEAAVNPL